MVCERWVERHILRERTSSSHIFFQEPRGSNACTPLQARQRRLWSAACPSLDCDSLLLSKPDRVVLITWPPSGYTDVRPEYPDAPSPSCLLIKMWQLTKAHGVARNEPKTRDFYEFSSVDWLVLKSCQLSLGYFTSRAQRIVFSIYLCLHFCVDVSSVFKKKISFCTWLSACVKIDATH